jgi:hypothetical protein
VAAYRLTLDMNQLLVLVARTRFPLSNPAAVRHMGQAVRSTARWCRPAPSTTCPATRSSTRAACSACRSRPGALKGAIELEWPYGSLFTCRVYVNGAHTSTGRSAPGFPSKPRPVSDYAGAIEEGHDEIDLKKTMLGKTVPFFGSTAKTRAARTPPAASSPSSRASRGSARSYQLGPSSTPSSPPRARARCSSRSAAARPRSTRSAAAPAPTSSRSAGRQDRLDHPARRAAAVHGRRARGHQGQGAADDRPRRRRNAQPEAAMTAPPLARLQRRQRRRSPTSSRRSCPSPRSSSTSTCTTRPGRGSVPRRPDLRGHAARPFSQPPLLNFYPDGNTSGGTLAEGRRRGRRSSPSRAAPRSPTRGTRARDQRRASATTPRTAPSSTRAAASPATSTPTRRATSPARPPTSRSRSTRLSSCS